MVPEDPTPTGVDNGRMVGDPEAPPSKPEVGTLLPQAHGGSLRYGNPGNAGGPGGRLPAVVRQEIGRMVREHGLPFLERVLSRQEFDVVPIKVRGPDTFELVDKKIVKLAGGERVEYATVPVNTRTVVGALAVALAGSEGMVAPEKAGLTKRRRLEIIVRHE